MHTHIPDMLFLKRPGRRSWPWTGAGEAPLFIVDEGGRRVYARAIVAKRNGTYAGLTGPQESNILTSMVRANGLAICPKDTPAMQKGQRVQARTLDWDEEGIY